MLKQFVFVVLSLGLGLSLNSGPPGDWTTDEDLEELTRDRGYLFSRSDAEKKLFDEMKEAGLEHNRNVLAVAQFGPKISFCCSKIKDGKIGLVCYLFSTEKVDALGEYDVRRVDKPFDYNPSYPPFMQFNEEGNVLELLILGVEGAGHTHFIDCP